MKFQFKGFTSLLLSIAFVVMTLSGVILYFTPRGRTPDWVQWLMFGLKKPGWEAIHVNICLLFLIVAVLHLTLNWSVFWDYIKKAVGLGLNMKTEMLVAAVLAAVVLTGTLYQLPPFSIIKGYSDRQGPPGERGPGFGRGFGQGPGNRTENIGQGEGQGRQFRGGRGPENPEL